MRVTATIEKLRTGWRATVTATQVDGMDGVWVVRASRGVAVLHCMADALARGWHADQVQWQEIGAVEDHEEHP